MSHCSLNRKNESLMNHEREGIPMRCKRLVLLLVLCLLPVVALSEGGVVNLIDDPGADEHLVLDHQHPEHPVRIPQRPLPSPSG